MTDRKRAEEALAASEIRYRRLFETAKDGILILDADTGKIIDANPFMTELLGYSHDEFLGKELWEIGLFSDKSASRSRLPGTAREWLCPLRPFAAGNQERASGSRSSSSATSIRWTTSPSFSATSGTSPNAAAWSRQTQEQAAALADLHRRKDEFLAMLSPRTSQPAGPHPQRRATAPSPERTMRPDSSSKPARIIERQVGQLTRLVDDLLEVSRITTGRIQLHQERIAVSGIVERAVETARPLIDQRKHELTVSLPPQPIWLHADAARLEQVVVNLLTNAAKYTDEGGHIWLTVQQEGDEAVLRVRDTGVGIAPELLPRIFDLFTQAERSLDRSQGGLGIGLALVQRLVEMHGGTVEASSALGQGSEFVVRLPVVPTPAPQPPSPPTETAKPTGPSLRVLVVDDNVDTADELGDAVARVRP